MKVPVSFRLTEVAKQILAALARHLGISKTAVIELAIREKANRYTLPGDDLPSNALPGDAATHLLPDKPSLPPPPEGERP